ncbi:DMT family transporter [Rhizobium sp. BG4]|uniref:DMT family transporter n=1 Tax=Rhizobium sp. BG4 TaxID=2613770 RepID=UPI00193D580B|nr:DMT family transporter [Rhizobium sp. BG4]QRM47201.1 DMT family transporter [Rhizobium sp. BG4]
MNRRRSAQAQVLLAATFFSTAGVFVGLIKTDLWSIIFWRSLFSLAFTSALMILAPTRHLTKPDRSSLLAVFFSASGMLVFVAALRLTSVANVAVIYGTLPLMTAMIAWLIVGERISRSTAFLCLQAAFGALVIFWGSTSSGLGLAGDGLALSMTVLMALMTIAMRNARSSALVIVASSNGLAALVGAVCSPSLAVDIGELGMLAGFALVQMTLGLLCYTAGSRLLPPAETALLTLAEMPMSAFWVWAAFGDSPPPLTLVGAAVILTAVIIKLNAPETRRSSNEVEVNGDTPGR